MAPPSLKEKLHYRSSLLVQLTNSIINPFTTPWKSSTGGARSSAIRKTCLQIGVFLVWQGHCRSLGHFLLVLVEELLVDLNLRWCKGWRSDELELRVADQFSSEPEERFFEVVVGFGRNVIVLEVFLAVECDGLGLDLALLDIDLVSAKNDRNVFADTDEITWKIFVNTEISEYELGVTYGASWGRSCR